MPKPIRFTHHALENMKKRGTTEFEVNEAITQSSWAPARDGRFECTRDFPYNELWNKKFYTTKQVMPVFCEESDGIIVITVYVFYF